MEIEDEVFIDDDQDILDIINFGFPRRRWERADHFDTMDNVSFFKRFRLRKETILDFLPNIEPDLEYDNDLNDSVSPMNQLLSVLRIYACGGHQTSIGDFIGAHQSTISRILHKVTNAIARLRPDYIKLPDTDRERLKIATDFYNIARFPRCGGCIDGCHIRMQSPGGNDAEIFRNRKSYFSVNTQAVCDAHLKIRDIVARWPGSAHDVTLFNASAVRARFENREFGDSILLGDSGYPNRDYLLVPLQNPVGRPEQLYNESHIRTRNTIERTFGVWKRRFPILAYGLRYKPEFASNIIVASAVLHNLAIDHNDPVPPAPENIAENELNYLIEIGNIQENINEVELQNFNLRRHFINNHFALL